MEYKIKFTANFLYEFEEICEYISIKLQNTSASNKLRDKIIFNVEILKKSPRIFAEIETIGNLHKKYRRIVVENFVILYTIDEEKNEIFISHIYYSGKNYIKQ